MPDYSRNVYCLLGLPFDAIDMAHAAEKIRTCVEGNQRCFLSTPNLNFLIACRTDPIFKASVVNSDLVVADGMPIVWLARLLGIPIHERVAGSDLFEVLRRPGGKRKINVFFFGGQDGVAEAAEKKINSEDLGMCCVGHHSPGFGTLQNMSSAETLEKINKTQADFLVVSLGARKGQEWITHNLQALHTPVVSHLGAVINFIAGSVRRAPRAFQIVGLEWLWRIKEEPQLWKRYLQDGLGLVSLMVSHVIPLLVSQKIGQFARNSSAPATIQMQHYADRIDFVLKGQWDVNSLQPLREALTQVSNSESKDMSFDMHATTGIDSAFTGLLLLAQGYQIKNGHTLKIERPSLRVARQLKWMGATTLCNGD